MQCLALVYTVMTSFRVHIRASNMRSRSVLVIIVSIIMGCCPSTEAGAGVVEKRNYAGMSPAEILLAEEWDAIDQDKSGDLDETELMRLMERIGVSISPQALKKHLKKFDKDGSGTLSRDELVPFFEEVSDRPTDAFDALIAQYGQDGKLSAAQFAKFQAEHQGEHAAAGETPDQMLARFRASLLRSADRAAESPDGVDPAIQGYRQTVHDAAEKAAEEEGGGGAAGASTAGGGAAGAAGDGASKLNPLQATKAKSGGSSESMVGKIPVSIRRNTAAVDGAEGKRAQMARSAVSGSSDTVCVRELMALLTNPEVNGIIANDRAQRVWQDMTRPLSHYHVSSTHNSYLAGNQLWGESSADALRRALSLGARVVELDTYDGDPEPIITHGGTLTSTLGFREAVRAIGEYAFRKQNVRPSQYPVIITIENHCSQEQQAVQARILKEELGDKLHVPPATRPRLYPSPEELKGKVVIRDKPGVPLPVQGEEGGVEAPTEAQVKAAQEADVEEEGEGKEGKGGAAASGGAGGGSKHSKAMHPDLLALITVPNVKFKGLDKLEVLGAGSTSSSFDEDKIVKVAGKSPKSAGFIGYTQTHLARTYPRGLRVDSSNYNPTFMWQVGCQIVALNYQSDGLPVHINQGKFNDNGGSGYVLKAPHLLPADGKSAAAAVPADFDVSGNKAPAKMDLKIELISGHYLPQAAEDKGTSDVVDPYVVIRVNGCEADESSWTSSTVKDNGINPRWKGEVAGDKYTAKFSVKRPETAVITFEVWDADTNPVNSDDLCAVFSCPLDAVRPGLRVVPLWDVGSVPLPLSNLFVSVTREDKE